MAGFIDVCRFIPASGGTADWTYSSQVSGYQSPALAGAQNGRLYKFRAESSDLTQWEETEGAYNSSTGTFARTTVLFNSLGTTAKVNFTTVPQVAVVALKEDLLATDESCLALGMTNGQLSATASAGQLTVSVLTTAGNTPSLLDPVYFYFRDNTLTAGDVVRIAVTASLTFIINSGNTLGATSGNGLRVWIAAFNNAGTVQLAGINCSDANGVFCPQESVKYTTTVPANATKAFYSTSAISTAAPWRFIGFCEWSSLTTAGTWTAPTTVHLSGLGTKRPGDQVQVVYGSTNSPTSSTSSTFVSTNLTASITPQSAANPVRVDWCGSGRSGNGNATDLIGQMFRGSTAIGQIKDIGTFGPSGTITIDGWIGGVALDLPNSTSSIAYTTKIKNQDNATTIAFPVSGAGAEIILTEYIG